MFPVSDQFQDAMGATHVVVRKVEVWNSGNFIQDITQYVTAGSVSIDETRQVRRTCTLTLAVPYSLIPAIKGDLLHPAGGNELYLYRGVKYPNPTALTFGGHPNGQIVTEEFAQLGVFRMTKPVIADDGTNVTVTVNGQDRSALISRISWQEPYSIAVGTDMGAAIKAAMINRLSGTSLANIVQYNIPVVTGYTVPATIWGANPGTSTNDPMADMIKLAAVGGYQLYFDFYGNPTMSLVVNPTSNPIVDTFTEGISLTSTSQEQTEEADFPISDVFSDIGVNYCRMTQLQRTLDETMTSNGVIVYANGVGAALPFTVAVWDTNIDSPTYYNPLDPSTSSWGPVPYSLVTTAIPAVGQTLTAAQAQATVMASAQLQLILGAFDETAFQCVPNPALDAGDCINLVRVRIKVNATYVCSSLTVPLDVQSAEQISNRPLQDIAA